MKTRSRNLLGINYGLTESTFPHISSVFSQPNSIRCRQVAQPWVETNGAPPRFRNSGGGYASPDDFATSDRTNQELRMTTSRPRKIGLQLPEAERVVRWSELRQM